jgi:hypothetical protein
MSAAKSLPPLAERFWSKVDRSGDACWPWLAAITSTGYGAIRVDGTLRKAHRVAYELEVGPIPEGMQLDHQCHNRACVRPSHLNAVTNQQNGENRRGAQANSRSGVRGVTWYKPYGKWKAEVTRDGVTHFGGYFSDLDEAAERARDMRLVLHTNNLTDRRGVA